MAFSQLDTFRPLELVNVVWAAAALGHRLDGNLLRGTLALAQVPPVTPFRPSPRQSGIAVRGQFAWMACAGVMPPPRSAHRLARYPPMKT